MKDCRSASRLDHYKTATEAWKAPTDTEGMPAATKMKEEKVLNDLEEEEEPDLVSYPYDSDSLCTDNTER